MTKRAKWNIRAFLIIILALSLFSINVFAINDWNSNNNGDMGNMQSIYYSTNLSNTSAGGLQNGNYQYINVGGSYSPSVIDIDTDGTNELITYSGSSIYIYNGSNNYLQLEKTISLNGTIKNIQASEYAKATSSTMAGIVALTTTNVYLIGYYGGVTYTRNLFNISKTLSSNIACGNDKSTSTYVFYCGYFTNESNNQILNYFHSQYFLTLITTPSTSIASYTKNYSSTPLLIGNQSQSLNVYDVDADLEDEFVFITTANILVKKWDNENLTYNRTIETTYSAPSLYKNYVAYGDSNTGSTTTRTIYIKDILTNAVVSGTISFTSSLKYYSPQQFVFVNSQLGVLANIGTTSTWKMGLLYLNGTTTEVGSGTNCQATDIRYYASSGILNSTSTTTAVLLGNCLIYGGTLGSTTSGYTTSSGVNYVIADISGDYDSEIIEWKAGYTGIKFKNALNIPSALSISGQANGGYSGYYSPVCTNTTITFQAKECLAEPYSNCNYFNSVENERERIASSCGGLYATIQNGSYSYVNPSLDCYFNSTGNYAINLYLQQESKPTDYGVKNPSTINISVINGLAGVDCNINYIENPTFNGTTPTDETTDEVTLPDGFIDQTGDTANLGVIFDVLLGGNAMLRIFIAMCLIIAVMLLVASYTHNGFVITLSAVLMTILTTAIGLLPIYILILVILFAILIIIYNKFFSQSATGG